LTNSSLDYLAVLEDVLKDLGVDNLSVLYYHLEKLGVKKHEIPDKPAEFSNALRVIFGQAATILERQIVSNIAIKNGGDYDKKNTLAEALRSLKKESAVN
jgi:hypothetical protein